MQLIPTADISAHIQEYKTYKPVSVVKTVSSVLDEERIAANFFDNVSKIARNAVSDLQIKYPNLIRKK